MAHDSPIAHSPAHASPAHDEPFTLWARRFEDSDRMLYGVMFKWLLTELPTGGSG